MPEIGKPAPDFLLPQAGGGRQGVSQYAGQKNILIATIVNCYTPESNDEFAAFRRDIKKFEAAGIQIVGISTDSRFALNAFGTSMGALPFPLAADFQPVGDMSRKYGIYREEDGVCERACFLIDKQGILRWQQIYNGEEFPDNAQILAEASKLSS